MLKLQSIYIGLMFYFPFKILIHFPKFLLNLGRLVELSPDTLMDFFK